MLELGCGEGNDSIYFANQGHTVTATDFSDIAIKQDKERWSNPRLRFEILDISTPFSWGDKSFSVVYARLSLHYFRDDATKAIFKEIHRVLRPGGLLCCMCKEVRDSIYGKGNEIEPDMYELDGHVRHFFSERYAKRLLEYSDLRTEMLETGKETIYDRQSAFIKIVAKK